MQGFRRSAIILHYRKYAQIVIFKPIAVLFSFTPGLYFLLMINYVFSLFFTFKWRQARGSLNIPVFSK